jgi:lipopolysaccharide/colanic/teichoic acid biosynthesis glycosyltransferase
MSPATASEHAAVSPATARRFIRTDVTPLPGRRRKEHAATGGPAPRSHRLHVVNEEIFRGVLLRERKRADRSNAAFVLLLLEINAKISSAEWRHVVDALAAAKRDTDVIGWFERGRVVGLILLEGGVSDASVCRALEDRVRGELTKRLDPTAMASVAIGVHVHPAPSEDRGEGAEAVDPLLVAIRPRSDSSPAAWIKRGLDIMGSLLLLLMVAPAFLIIAALIKFTSRGPVFFRQVRIGQEAKPFTILKFRTMAVNADHALHRDYVSGFIQASGQAQSGQRGSHNGVFKLTHDPRITPVGRILRKTSLDELPQFLNVLTGEMSLVGPRPPIPYEVEQYKPWHCRRVLDAKPGITGLWQVSGRSRTTFDEMVRLDLRYARNRSFWTDIKILLATPRAVISGKGAC